jgi:hypothetical protein
MITPQADRPPRPSSTRLTDPSADGSRHHPAGPGWLVLVFAPLLCCGGPLLITAAATLGAVAWGAVGVAVALVATAVLIIVRRRSCRCCEPELGRRSAAGLEADVPADGMAVSR